MSQRILDEREHRRGLVLGLTLAEVLILLLFMLLLALGHRLSLLEQDKKRADIERKEFQVVLGAIRPHLPEEIGRPDERSAKELASRVAWTIALEQRFPLLVGKLDDFSGLIEAAVKADPNDPPAALRAATGVLKKLRPTSGSTQLNALEKKVIEVEAKLAAVNPLPSPATKDSPNDPPTLLTRTLVLVETLDRLLPEIRPDFSQSPPKTGTIGGEGKHDWPPIITLSEAAGYFFASGSPELSAEFQAKLSTTVIARLLQITNKYDVDVIEVIGHTDEQRLVVRASRADASPEPASPPRPVQRPVVRSSNLDSTLIPFLSGKEALERLAPSDNAGLGLARAASVVHVLLKDERLHRFSILPLSGGQLIEAGDHLSVGQSPGNVKERRRIEIRVRRSEKWQGRVSHDRSRAPAK